MLYEHIIRPTLFRLWEGDPEEAHEHIMALLCCVGRHPALLRILSRFTSAPVGMEQTLFGVRFPSPIGLAGGFDKNAVALPCLAALGFGFIEAGTVTLRPQPGNPRPRLFRLVDDKGLINRMGFNNEGAQAMAARLDTTPRLQIPLGISLGKNKKTPLSEAISDYIEAFRLLCSYGDYFVINVSSPNTPGLRSLQDRGHLDALVQAMVQEASALADNGKPKPILVKVSPDLTWEALDEVLDVCATRGVSGVIATNTTISREGLKSRLSEEGGLSGHPLFERSLHVVEHVRKGLPNMPIIASGGILSESDAMQMFASGANLLQVYTGFIYNGPFFVRNMHRAIARSTAGTS